MAQRAEGFPRGIVLKVELEEITAGGSADADQLDGDPIRPRRSGNVAEVVNEVADAGFGVHNKEWFNAL